jgi:hypothetical protein
MSLAASRLTLAAAPPQARGGKELQNGRIAEVTTVWSARHGDAAAKSA